ncbi:MAG: HTH domain-containing protein [bacterium]|nr:HTH domain-containing protein [bacterium]
MQTDTKDKIREFIKEKGNVSAKEIISRFDISRQSIFRHLAKLLEKGEIGKAGKPPKVFYFIPEKKQEIKQYNVPDYIRDFIEKRFFNITPIGEIKNGWQGFSEWCVKGEQGVEKSAFDYFEILSKYEKIRKDGLIDGMNKMKNTFSEVYLDHVFYIDFYSIERFGKTKLGKILLYAKQSQSKKMIREISNQINPYVKKLIKKYNIEAIAFIPPTVKREIQIMKELENNLNFNLPKIGIFKVKTEIAVPQKTLNKLEDRIENAKATFFIEESRTYKNVLLIDDAVGSGATLNEIAAKIKHRGIVSGKIIGLAITGSLKGFDVISEV